MASSRTATPTDVDAKGMPEVAHERFCLPRPGADEPRIESFPAVRGEGKEAKTVTVTRCIECGASRVDE